MVSFYFSWTVFSNCNSCIGGFGPLETLEDPFPRGPPEPIPPPPLESFLQPCIYEVESLGFKGLAALARCRTRGSAGQIRVPRDGPGPRKTNHSQAGKIKTSDPCGNVSPRPFKRRYAFLAAVIDLGVIQGALNVLSPTDGVRLSRRQTRAEAR